VRDVKTLLCETEGTKNQMEETPGHVLKSNDVKVEGHFRLDAGITAPSQAKAGNAMSAQRQVVVVENHPEFAVMEVTCRCGDKTHIRCEYATAHSTEQKQDHQNDGENDDES